MNAQAPPIDDTILLTPEQMAAQLQVEIRTFREMVKSGAVPFYAVGKRQRFLRTEVLAALAGRQKPHNTPEPAFDPESTMIRRRRLGKRQEHP